MLLSAILAFNHRNSNIIPVVGLSTVLESALVAMLNEKLLRSWKITEENQNAVVVIRLTAVHTPGTAIEPQRDGTAITQCS